MQVYLFDLFVKLYFLRLHDVKDVAVIRARNKVIFLRRQTLKNEENRKKADLLEWMNVDKLIFKNTERVSHWVNMQVNYFERLIDRLNEIDTMIVYFSD